MDKLLYKLCYSFSQPNWENGLTPDKLITTASTCSDKPGTALDLGCGTGTQAVALAGRGWTVYGIDFVPKAIRIAHAKADQAGLNSNIHFLQGNISKLNNMGIPKLDFAYDLGCLHTLKSEDQRKVIIALAGLLPRDRIFLLFGLKFRNETGYKYGLSKEQVTGLIEPYFTLDSYEEDMLWDKPGAWYLLRRSAA